MLNDKKILQGFSYKRLLYLDYLMAYLPLWGKFGSVRYASANIDSSTQTIFITLKVKLSGDQQYFDACKEGISQYWSRQITLDGQVWQVKVTAVDDKNGLDITVRDPENDSDKSTFKFRFPKSRIFVINKHGLPWMKRTAAHEVGHAIITDSFGRKESSTHHGTSTTDNEILDSAFPYPRSGEIDLMKYYPDTNTGQDFLGRSTANENDVKGLVYIAFK